MESFKRKISLTVQILKIYNQNEVYYEPKKRHLKCVFARKEKNNLNHFKLELYIQNESVSLEADILQNVNKRLQKFKKLQVHSKDTFDIECFLSGNDNYLLALL